MKRGLGFSGFSVQKGGGLSRPGAFGDDGREQKYDYTDPYQDPLLRLTKTPSSFLTSGSSRGLMTMMMMSSTLMRLVRMEDGGSPCNIFFFFFFFE